MKMQKIVMAFLIILFAFSLNASVRLNSLGKYFAYLVPDLDTDSELFPTYLLQYEKKQAHFSTQAFSYSTLPQNDFNVSWLPLTGKFRLKCDISAGTISNDPIMFLNDYSSYYYNSYYRFRSEISKNSKTSANLRMNFAFDLAGMDIGGYIGYGKAIADALYETNNFDYGYSVEYYDRDIDLDEDHISTGLNLAFNDFNVTFSYTDIEIDFIEYEEIKRTANYDNYSPQVMLSNNEIDVGKNSEMYSMAFLKTMQKGKVENRILGSISYKFDEMDYAYSSARDDSSYYDSPYSREFERDRKEIISEKRDVYSARLGYSSNIEHQKADFHLAAVVLGKWQTADRGVNFSNYERSITTYPDTIEITIKEIEEFVEFEVNEYEAELQLPVGVTFHLTDKIDLLGGLGFAVNAKKSEFGDGSSVNWNVLVDKSMGLSVKPLESIQLDVNYRGDLARYSYWLINLKYLW